MRQKSRARGERRRDQGSKGEREVKGLGRVNVGDGAGIWCLNREKKPPPKTSNDSRYEMASGRGLLVRV